VTATPPHHAGLQVEHQPVSATAGDAGHHRLVGQAFFEAEDRVAVFGNAVEDADLARAAGAFTASGQDVRACPVDDVENAVILTDG